MNNMQKHPIITILVIEIVALALFFLFGFRITYNPWLENNWDAISACAAWAGVIASVAALYAAIQIPKRIADRQDRIALFEKRFEFYRVLHDFVMYARMINNSVTNEEIRIYFIASFSNQKPTDWTKESIDGEVIRLERYATDVLEQGAFLFNIDFTEWIKPLVSGIVSLLSTPDTHKNFRLYYQQYMEAVKNAEDHIVPEVEKALTLHTK